MGIPTVLQAAGALMERSQAPMAGEMTGLPRYTGTTQPVIGAVGPDGRRLYPYIPPPELVEAANLSMFLGRPLLIRGEPGCGKSLFASAIAYELGLPLTIWNIRSTTRAADGLYTYDAIARLRDAQIEAAAGNAATASHRSSTSDDPSVERYIRLG